MNTFQEYQEAAVKTPLSLRSNRDRVDFPVMGLQQEAGKIGVLFGEAFRTGRLTISEDQKSELQDRLADVLWCVALLSNEAGIKMDDLAAHSLALLKARAAGLDPDQR